MNLGILGAIKETIVKFHFWTEGASSVSILGFFRSSKKWMTIKGFVANGGTTGNSSTPFTEQIESIGIIVNSVTECVQTLNPTNEDWTQSRVFRHRNHIILLKPAKWNSLCPWSKSTQQHLVARAGQAIAKKAKSEMKDFFSCPDLEDIDRTLFLCAKCESTTHRYIYSISFKHM